MSKSASAFVRVAFGVGLIVLWRVVSPYLVPRILTLGGSTGRLDLVLWSVCDISAAVVVGVAMVFTVGLDRVSRWAVAGLLGLFGGFTLIQAMVEGDASAIIVVLVSLILGIWGFWNVERLLELVGLAGGREKA